MPGTAVVTVPSERAMFRRTKRDLVIQKRLQLFWRQSTHFCALTYVLHDFFQLPLISRHFREFEAEQHIKLPPLFR